MTHDVLGLSERVPRFARRYASLGEEVESAAAAFRSDVECGAFPAPDESLAMADDEWAALLTALGPARAGQP